MIDWHSHVLPGMDDGSRDVTESLSLIRAEVLQGVRTVIATPHFCANAEPAASFLERRERAMEALKAALPEGSPEIRLGAEVKYYQGISRMADLKALRTEGSKVLLLEMPMSVWSEYTVRELVGLAGDGSVQLVLAHVERYFSFQTAAVRDRIREAGILTQVNASFFASFASKRKATALLREGKIQLIGSDCHNMTSRPPRIGQAYDVIQKKFGENYVSQMNEYGCSLLGKTVMKE
ncbi:MAG: hypothetical protein IJR89_00605 [Clostridia bacterium]|nr:hypothetical protein [Clostridia bacterium]